jgi:hypothetical protein
MDLFIPTCGGKNKPSAGYFEPFRHPERFFYGWAGALAGFVFNSCTCLCIFLGIRDMPLFFLVPAPERFRLYRKLIMKYRLTTLDRVSVR